MVEEKVERLEAQVTDLRVAQASLSVELASTVEALKEVEAAIKELTSTMHMQAGERRGAKAVIGTVGAVVGAIATLLVEWFSRSK